MTTSASDANGSSPISRFPHAVLRWWGDRVGFRDPRKLVFTLLLIVVPFVVVGGAAFIEKRFFLGSVVTPHEDVLCPGMSFLGDPMVWPYMVLIPLLLIALRAAVVKVERFLGEDLDRCLRPEWKAENEEEVASLRQEARFGLEGRGVWTYIYWGALGLGLIFFIFNLLVCTVPAFQLYEAECPTLGKDVPAAKWDTDCKGATLSWGASRLWVLTLGYMWLPLILARFLNVVFVVTKLFSKLGRTGRPFHVRPLHPDGACGLGPISGVTLSFVYPLLFLALMVMMQFLKEASTPGWHNYALVIAFAPLFFLAFFLPLRSVHGAMKRVQAYALGKVYASYERMSTQFMESLRKPEPDEAAIASQGEALRGIKDASETLRAMPTWPFGLRTIRKLVVTALVTLAPLALKVMLPWLKQLMGA